MARRKPLIHGAIIPFQCYVQIVTNANMNQVSARIKDAKLHRVKAADAAFKPVVFPSIL